MTVFIKDLDKNCECYLIGIEFEDKIMKVRPLDTEIWEDEVFEISIDVVTRGDLRMKVIR
jgi:hypothetical protein